mgnify:CR=1 FL=1
MLNPKTFLLITTPRKGELTSNRKGPGFRAFLFATPLIDPLTCLFASNHLHDIFRRHGFFKKVALEIPTAMLLKKMGSTPPAIRASPLDQQRPGLDIVDLALQAGRQSPGWPSAVVKAGRMIASLASTAAPVVGSAAFQRRPNLLTAVVYFRRLNQSSPPLELGDKCGSGGLAARVDFQLDRLNFATGAVL